jgi:hypothetical protein
MLSESAVALLRFEIKGYRLAKNASRLEAYRELAAAGIMEAVPGTQDEFRFTERGIREREAILERESDRIEQERYAPPDAPLTMTARDQLRHFLAGDREVTVANRPAYRELVEARVMVPVHTFAGGRDSAFRLTYWGWERRFELAETARAKEAS